MVSKRIEKVNRHIQRTVGEILLKEAELPDSALVTISRVETTSNLRSCAVWLLVTPPEKGQETLDTLKGQMYDIQGSFNRSLNMHPLPRITFRLEL